MNDFIVGTSALDDADPALMKQAGIDYVRLDFPFPFADRLGGDLAPAYLSVRQAARDWSAKGFQIMGVTPLHGVGGYQPAASGDYQFVWHDWAPAYLGQPNAPAYSENYREVCAFLATDLKGLVQMWQISNELNIPMFAGPLDYINGCELILHGAQGLKQADRTLIVGPNSALPSLRYYFYGRLFADRRAAFLDYVGIDAYFGTWDPGGPDNWEAALAELFDLTHVKMLVNEWGFASAGGLMNAVESGSGMPECQARKWRNAWGGGHSPESQSQFVRAAMQVFHRQRADLLGAFFYRWEDQATCWQCGSPDCPVETAWGLVDRQGRPKPAFYAHQQGAAQLKGSGARLVQLIKE